MDKKQDISCRQKPVTAPAGCCAPCKKANFKTDDDDMLKPSANMSEAALLHLLSRAATVSMFLTPHYKGSPFSANTSDTIRMLKSTGARYAGRSAFVWGGEQQVPAMLPHVKATAALVHAACPELALEGGVFEIITKAGVEQIQIPYVSSLTSSLTFLLTSLLTTLLTSLLTSLLAFFLTFFLTSLLAQIVRAQSLRAARRAAQVQVRGDVLVDLAVRRPLGQGLERAGPHADGVADVVLLRGHELDQAGH